MNNHSSIRRISIFLFLVGSIPLRAQSGKFITHSPEQTGFTVEGEFQKPVPIPAGALQSLRMSKDPDEQLQVCAKEVGIATAEIPASWFITSEIKLSQKSSPGLVIRGKETCLGGAHIAQFWVLAKSAAGYSVVFSGRADKLDILPTSTNGYRDLQLAFVRQAGAYVDYVRFRYSKGKYHISGRRTEHFPLADS